MGEAGEAGDRTAPGAVGPQETVPALSTALIPPVTQPAAAGPDVPVLPAPQPDNRPLPINLPTALHLANVRAVDIEAAGARMRVAAAVLEAAQVLWLPTITLGGDYNRHDGRNQDHGDGQRHGWPHRVDESLGEHRVRQLLDLVGHLGGYVRGQAQAGPRLSAPDHCRRSPPPSDPAANYRRGWR